MNTVMALDTATDEASVALAVDGVVTAERVLGPKQSASGLLPAVSSALQASNLDLADVDGFVIADGPGSFTGLRIGFATLAGLVSGREGRVFTIPSLAGVAAGAAVRVGMTVLAVYDALRGDVFAAAYQRTDSGLEERVPPRLMPGDDLDALGSMDAVVGSAVARELANGTVVAARAANLLNRGLVGGLWVPCPDIHTFSPAYGRVAEAQARWEREHGRSLDYQAGESR